MRNFKVIELDNPPSNRRVTLRELEVPQVRALVSEVRKRGEEFAFALLYGELGIIQDLLGTNIELSPAVGGSDGLSYSEIATIKKEFKELNCDFFDMAEQTGGVMAHLLTLSRQNLTEPVASSSPTDTPT